MDAKFKIPDLTMPTPERHREVSLAWLARIQPTLIDQWPVELAALSMPTKLIQIDPEAVSRSMWALHDDKPHDENLAALAAELDSALGWGRKFFRLNSRSPKDNMWPFETLATMSGREIVSVMAGSERVLDDLLEFKYVPEQPCFIALRDFVYGVEGSNEFRCFVKGGDLIAVTHYDYTKPAPEWIIKDALDIRSLINAYFTERLKPVLHVDTVVFDIAMMGDEILLIEINPYGRSDPCWFGSYAAVESATGAIQYNKPA